MRYWLAPTALLLTGIVLSGATEHNVVKRQAQQYPQRGRPPLRFRTGFQVAPEDEVVTEYVDPAYSQQQAPRYSGNLRVAGSIRGSQQPSFTIQDDHVDHQPPDYDQETPEPLYVLTTPRPAQTPYGPSRRRPQYPIAPPAAEVPQGPRLTQQDLSPISYATPSRAPQGPVPPPEIPASNRHLGQAFRDDEPPEEPAPHVPPPAAPVRTVLISNAPPPPSRPPLNFGGAVLVTNDLPSTTTVVSPPVRQQQRPRGPQRRPGARTTTTTTTEEPPLPPPPSSPAPRRQGARRQVVRLQNTQSNPTPPAPRTTVKPPTRRPVVAVPYNPDNNLEPPPDEEPNIRLSTESAPRAKFSRKPFVAVTTAAPTTTAQSTSRITSTRRPGGKRLRIGTLPYSRPSTTTEAPVEEEEDYDDPPPPPRSSSRRNNNGERASAPKPAVVYEEPSESQEEPDKRPPAANRNAARPTNKAFRPKPVDDYEDEPESKPKSSTSRSSSGRNRQRQQEDAEYDDYDEAGTYVERPYRARNNKNYRGRIRNREGGRGKGPPTSPKPTRRTPPKDLPKRKDGRVIDYMGDPNFPRELSGYDLTEYPFYTTLPDDVSNFDCEERANGFYASVPHQCQVFHYCFATTRFSFLCANFTLYDQTTFTCQFANKVNCEGSEKYYNRNDDLYKEEKKEEKKDEKKKPKESVEDGGEDYEEEEVKETRPRSRGGNTRPSASAPEAVQKPKSS